jgi:3-dehydroquinate synthase
MGKIKVRLKGKAYEIVIRHGLLKTIGVMLRRYACGSDAVVVSNKTIWAIYGRALTTSLKKSGISVHVEFVPDSERAKSFTSLKRLLDHIGAYDERKRLFVIAFGGGVIGDLAGFTAAVYKRGIPYVQVPTTLLAQVDSSIGGKTAIDLSVAKNLVGSFYQPRAVLTDTSILATLSERHFKNGLAEVIKYGVIADRGLFEYIERHYRKILAKDTEALEYIVGRASQIKARVVEKDEFDRTGVRAILNFGHTIGHAIEAAASYSSQYHHGEAIAIGMVVASRIALTLGMMSASTAGRIEALIERVGLPTRLKGIPLSRLERSYLRDKKFVRGKNRLVLPVCIGRVKVIEGVPDAAIKKAIRACMVH